MDFPIIIHNIGGSLTLSQWTLVGPVYTGTPLERHWLTQSTLEYHWVIQWILAGYIGTPLKNFVETAPQWNATGETQTIAAYTTGETITAPHTQAHIVKQSYIHASLK